MHHRHKSNDIFAKHHNEILKNISYKDEKSIQTESCKDDAITKTNKTRIKIRGNHLLN
jgi:hypothetical protein